MMVRRFMLAAALTAVLAACDNGAATDTPAPTGHDVHYYLDNPDERRAVIAECDNDPGSLGDTSNCINAYEADEEDMNRSIRDALGQD